MRIDHVALYVCNLDGVKDFFVKYLGAVSGDKYQNPVSGFQSYFLRFDGGARVELMSKPRMTDQPKDPNRTGYSHLAFSLGSKELVDALTLRLRNDGFAVLSGPRTTGDGYYESCIVAIEDNLIELTI
jgi:lactoylglutathione lyase